MFTEFKEFDYSERFIRYKNSLETLTDTKFYLTGSGSTLFTPFDSESEAKK